MEVTAVCSNPQEIKLKVTVEYTLPMWQEILKRIAATNHYYTPIYDIQTAAAAAIAEVEERTVIKGSA